MEETGVNYKVVKEKIDEINSKMNDLINSNINLDKEIYNGLKVDNRVFKKEKLDIISANLLNLQKDIDEAVKPYINNKINV